MPTFLICAPGIHLNLHISMLTEAMYYAGLSYLMGKLNYLSLAIKIPGNSIQKFSNIHIM